MLILPSLLASPPSLIPINFASFTLEPRPPPRPPPAIEWEEGKMEGGCNSYEAPPPPFCTFLLRLNDRPQHRLPPFSRVLAERSAGGRRDPIICLGNTGIQASCTAKEEKGTSALQFPPVCPPAYSPVYIIPRKRVGDSWGEGSRARREGGGSLRPSFLHMSGAVSPTARPDISPFRILQRPFLPPFFEL